MTTASSYQPRYSNSWALIIGIDKYQHAGPLNFAKNDADAIAHVLRERFGFPALGVTTLLDDAATRSGIMAAFLRYADQAVIGRDDRVVIFFAGHGHTVSSRRGETGFLVPVDGKVGDLATLIRWDDLTRNGDLIPAKHILFVMDACYGGLALTRQSLPPGSMRFLKDMLQRYSRQVITAGKGNEAVADGGGPSSPW